MSKRRADGLLSTWPGRVLFAVPLFAAGALLPNDASNLTRLSTAAAVGFVLIFMDAAHSRWLHGTWTPNRRKPRHPEAGSEDR